MRHASSATSSESGACDRDRCAVRKACLEKRLRPAFLDPHRGTLGSGCLGRCPAAGDHGPRKDTEAAADGGNPRRLTAIIGRGRPDGKAVSVFTPREVSRKRMWIHT